jgi:hypothetical protein
MAKSQSASAPLALNVVRGLSLVHDPEGSYYRAGDTDSPRGREQCLARA